ncbi:MAG: glycosyltransferase family 4 protein [Eubacterium sp.]|jgi:GalNAc-alpha-(1->4)-GalNAc-alpha-(1->3)-diNAcBac-PP-undecaprenol alpha-1,4-N-acetyl-D-galactosaminyltransferase|nr:glycosyltransferase family 4 protein [Eubacterium sp.]
MKFIFLIPGLRSGGAERVMATLANNFVNRGSFVKIITFTDEESYFPLDGRVILDGMGQMPDRSDRIKFISTLPAVVCRRFFHIAWTIRKDNPDAVLSFCNTANYLNAMQKMLVNRKTVSVISERSDPERYCRGVQWLCRLLYMHADAVICQNRVVKKYFLSIRKKHMPRVMVLPNPVSETSIPDRIVYRKNNYFAAAGRLVHEKRFDVLILAFAEFIKIHPEFRLKIYGEGPLRKKLENLVKEKGLEGYVELPGSVRDVMKKIQDASCFILSSEVEGFPNVLLEAMCSGMPVISVRLRTGIADKLIINGRNGYLTDIGDVDGMCRAMCRIIEKADLGEMSCNNFKIRELYGESRVSGKWLQALSSIKI